MNVGVSLAVNLKKEETGLAFLKTDVKRIRTVFIRYPHIDPSEHSDFKWITLIEALQ